jgi:hypothetical protein
MQCRIHFAGAVQQQQAGLRSDQHGHVVRHFQPLAADEFFLVQKLPDQALQLLLQLGRHAPVDGR